MLIRLSDAITAVEISPERFTVQDLVDAVASLQTSLTAAYGGVDQEQLADAIGWRLLELRDAYWTVDPTGETLH